MAARCLMLPLLLLLLAFALQGYAAAVTCPNRYYCHSDEAKYRSFTALINSFLNSTNVIKSLSITEQGQCARQCTSTEKCQSVNHYLKSDRMTCDLVDGNMWTNPNDLIQRSKSTHFFIKVSRGTFLCFVSGVLEL